jgi:hypothetical protein
MASKTQICNRALVLLGLSRLTDVETDSTETSEICNLVFDDLVDEVLSSGAWSNATFRAALNALDETPTYQYTYAFQLPTLPKILKVISVNEDSPGEVEYRIENGKLLTDESSISIKYIGRLTSTEDFGPYITRALIRRIALEISYTSVGRSDMTAMLQEDYARTLVECLANDNQQGTRPSIVANDLDEVR